MAVDEDALATKYNVTKLSVASGTQVSSRVSAIVAKLGSSSQTDSKPTILCLTAKAKAANKLISVVEIGKRELATKGIKCFQYNVLSSQMIEIDRQPSKAGDGDEDEAAFETMDGATTVGTKKKRNVPVLTIYLASRSIEELKIEYR